MLSEVNREYVKELISTMRARYPYYVLYTNSYTNTTNDYSFYIVFSENPVTVNSRYSYSFTGECVRYGVRSGNASSYNNGERLVVLSSVSDVTIDNYEFVYTNAEFTGYSVQPDIMALERTEQSHFDGLGIAICVILLSVIFFKLIRR